MDNKKVKQMICSICQSKMSKVDDKNQYDFDFVGSKLVFWVNRVGSYYEVPSFYVASLTADQLRGK